MPIVRHAGRRYATIPTSTAEDRRLSFKARGLLAYLLAKPDDWQVRMEDLTSQQDRLTSVRAALKELEAYGYVKRSRARAAGSNRIEWIWHVHDEPSAGFLTMGNLSSPSGAIGRFSADGKPADIPKPTNPSTHFVRASSEDEGAESRTSKAAALAEQARAITDAWWEWRKSSTGREPLQPYIGVRRIILRALKAGIADEDLRRAMAQVTANGSAISYGALERAMMDAKRMPKVNQPAEAYEGSL